MDEYMDEVMAFWRALMKDESQKVADRLKASEDLARYCGQGPEEAAGDRELRVFVDYGGLPCK